MSDELLCLISTARWLLTYGPSESRMREFAGAFEDFTGEKIERANPLNGTSLCNWHRVDEVLSLAEAIKAEKAP